MLILMLSDNFADARFIQKAEGNSVDSEIVKTCRKGCAMKFPLSADKPNWDNLMCSDYCSLLFKDRKKKIITTLMCTDDVCVRMTGIYFLHPVRKQFESVF